MSNPTDAISDELILAALDRAARHRGREGEALTSAIYDHLVIPARSGPARHVHRRLAALAESGVLVRSRRHGIVVWSLTGTGRRQLQRAQRTGTVALPESPQHRAWRNARTLAAQEITRFRKELRDCLTHALRLLDTEPPLPSDALFQSAEDLYFDCRRLGSATYCLTEWPEPNDAHPDTDEGIEPDEGNLDPAKLARLRKQRAGRRNTGNWSRHRTPRESA